MKLPPATVFVVFKFVVWRIFPTPTPPSFPIFLFFAPSSLKLLPGFFLGRGGIPQHAAALHSSSCHSTLTRGRCLFFILFDGHCFYLVLLHSPLPIYPSPPPSPSSLCILDHFLSFQVSGPVEADYPSPGGAGPPHCLRSVSLSLCSRYAHSPHPVCVGRWGRGAGRPQVCCRGHLLQQQTLTVLLVSLTHDVTQTCITHTHTHLFNMHHSTLQHRQPATGFYTERYSDRSDRQTGLSEEGRSRRGEFRGVQHTHLRPLNTERGAVACQEG